MSLVQRGRVHPADSKTAGGRRGDIGFSLRLTPLSPNPGTLNPKPQILKLESLNLASKIPRNSVLDGKPPYCFKWVGVGVVVQDLGLRVYDFASGVKERRLACRGFRQ